LRYVSTRGQAPALDFAGVVLEGLAPDGGLYLPETWPSLPDLATLRGLSYAEVAARVLTPFVGDCVDPASLRAMCDEAYGTFADTRVVPVSRHGDLWLMELFWGPTLAFKDIALQLLGRLFDHVLRGRDQRVTVIGATSGDTGSAAIEGCRGRAALDVFILHPLGRTSEIQRKQMTTVLDANVHNIALQGTFDDAQALVKQLFRDPGARDLHLVAVNSISWARVAAQIVYYVTTAVALDADQIDFVVPTGNFGDIFAGWCARRMGLPIRRLVIATNPNDILARTLATGVYRTNGVVPSLSPSMDIQVSSNFERALFEACGRDASRVVGWMEDLRTTGEFTLDETTLTALRAVFDAAAVSDADTTAEIGRVWQQHGVLLDPHTAVGVAAARRTDLGDGVPRVVLATAHAAKFPDAVRAATGQTPPLPPHLADLLDRPERYDVLPNDAAAVEAYVRAHVGPR
jgi:threonine synthase